MELRNSPSLGSDRLPRGRDLCPENWKAEESHLSYRQRKDGPDRVPRLSFRGRKQSGLFEDLKEAMSWGRGLLGCGPPPNPWGPRGTKHSEPWVVSVLGEMSTQLHEPRDGLPNAPPEDVQGEWGLLPDGGVCTQSSA